MEITEKEYAVINEIANNRLPDQRSIAIKAGISLGMTNLIIKNLVNKGYVKVKQLNSRKIQYFLTAKGFSEKAKKSYDYTVRVVNEINRARLRMKGLIVEEIQKGSKSIVMAEDNEMADLLELATLNLKDDIFLKRNNQHEDKKTIIVLDSFGRETRSVNLIEYISETAV